MRPQEGFEYLVKAYFHQDWDIDGSSSRAVLEYFANSETPEIVRAARDGAASLASDQLTEAELERRLSALGFAYDPTHFGESHNDWVQEVIAVLSDSLPEQ